MAAAALLRRPRGWVHAAEAALAKRPLVCVSYHTRLLDVFPAPRVVASLCCLPPGSVLSVDLAPRLPRDVRVFSTRSGVRTEKQAVGAVAGRAAPRSPVTVFVSLPGATESVEASVRPQVSSKGFFAALRKDPDFKQALATLDLTKLEVRVLWKAQPGAPSTELALTTPALLPELPLLDQVHEVGADGSVSATPVAWSKLAPRGGFFYVHVHNTAPVVVQESDDFKTEEIARFTAALRNVTVTDLEGGCQLLTLPNDEHNKTVKWLGLESNVLFVRPVFRRLYEDPELLNRMDPGDRSFVNILLRGVPGIGKSSFGQYVLWRLVLEKRAVMYEYPKALGVGERIKIKGNGYPAYIVDGCSPSAMARIKLLISSPRGGGGGDRAPVYDEFKKDATSLYMPTPTPAEVLLMRDHCFDATKPELSNAAIEERMSRWGPIPRYVLYAIDSEAKELAAAIIGQKLDALRDFVQSMSEAVVINSITFRIVHYEISDNLKNVTYKWASPYVGKEVARVLQKADLRDRLVLLRDMLSDTTWLRMSTYLFQEWSGLCLQRGGTFRVRRLGVGSTKYTGGKRAERLPGVVDNPMLFEQADKALGVEADKDGSLRLVVKPANTSAAVFSVTQLPPARELSGTRVEGCANFAAADFVEAFGVCSNATVSSSHDLLLQGVEPGRGFLHLVRQLYPERASHTAVPFLWLVPALVFNKCSAGVMVIETPKVSTDGNADASGTAREAVKAAGELAPYVVQYAVEIPSPSVVTSASSLNVFSPSSPLSSALPSLEAIVHDAATSNSTR